MPSTKKSIAVAILVSLLFAPVAAWAAPATTAAADAAAMDAPSFAGWLEMIWSRVVQLVQPTSKPKPTQPTRINSPPTETGNSLDPWG